MAVSPNTTAPAPNEQESPQARVHRLASELSEALNYFNGGAWSAYVYPSDAKRNSFGFAQDVEPRSRSIH